MDSRKYDNLFQMSVMSADVLMKLLVVTYGRFLCVKSNIVCGLWIYGMNPTWMA